MDDACASRSVVALESCTLPRDACCLDNGSGCCPAGCACIRAAVGIVCSRTRLPSCAEVREDVAMLWLAGAIMGATCACILVRRCRQAWAATTSARLREALVPRSSVPEQPGPPRLATIQEEPVEGAAEDDVGLPSYVEAVPEWVSSMAAKKKAAER